MNETPDVWAPGAAPPPAPVSKVPPAASAHEPGELPPIKDLLQETIEDFTANLKAYLMLGLGLTVLFLPAVLLIVAVGIGPMIAGILSRNDALTIGGSVLYLLALLVGLPLVLGPTFMAVHHAVNAHLDGDEDALGFGGMYRHLGRSILPGVALNLAMMALTLVGALFCYVGAFVVQAALVFAVTGVVVNGLGLGASMGQSIKHFRENLGWHFGLWAIGFAIMMIAGNIPIVGYAVGIPLFASFTLRGHRAVFGATGD